MKLGKYGIQPYIHGRGTSADLYRKNDNSPLKDWSDRFTMRVKPGYGELCVMECKQCKANLIPVNVLLTIQPESAPGRRRKRERWRILSM